MNLAEARETLLNSVLHVGNESYSPAKLDRALQFALERFMRLTRCDVETQDFTTTANTATVDLTSTWTDFLPYQVDSVRIGYEPVHLNDFDTIRAELENSETTGQPERIGWETPSAAYMTPIPDSAYTLTVARAAPLSRWTPGTESEVTINVPEAFIRDAIWFGAGPALVYGESGSLYASQGWRQFEQLIKEVRGATSMLTGSVWKKTGRRRTFPVEGGTWYPPRNI